MAASSQLPLISSEIKNYLDELLGIELAKKYLKAITIPMEEYTLHIFQKYELVDTIIAILESLGFNAYQHPNYHNMIVTEPKGPFNIDFSKELKEIVVDNRAAEMIYQGADIFVSGIKRANKVKEDDFVYIKNQRNIFVAKAKALMSHNTMLSEKKGIAAINLESPYKVPSVEQLGLQNFPIYFHSIPAYLSALNLEPQHGDRILDCCAAPGNKTIHLSELINKGGEIIAVDRSERRLSTLNEKIRKFSIKNVRLVVANIIELSKEWSVKFDKILVDPPCTALGLRPRLVIDTDRRLIESTANYQKAILYACNKLLKPGGELIYSTCTITQEENESVVLQAIHLGLKIIEQRYEISKMKSIGIELPVNVQRFIPGEDKTLGYFIAKFRKDKS